MVLINYLKLFASWGKKYALFYKAFDLMWDFFKIQACF
jgi:hypothetical protein